MATKIFCGTPVQFCNGAVCTVNNGWRWSGDGNLKGGARLHNTSEEAFKCHAAYLVKQGYERVGQREFLRPGGPVLMLPKKSHFGHRMRGGKSEKQEASRFVPRSHQGCIC